MSRIDHAAVAHEILAHTPTNGGVTYSDWMAEAQVHATLALVEQQRIANLIALFDIEDAHVLSSAGSRGLLDRRPDPDIPGDWTVRLWPEVAAALGIEVGS